VIVVYPEAHLLELRQSGPTVVNGRPMWGALGVLGIYLVSRHRVSTFLAAREGPWARGLSVTLYIVLITYALSHVILNQ